MPLALIELLEAQIAHLHITLAAPEFYKQSGEQIAVEQTKLKKLEDSLAAAFVRWELLESQT